MIDVRHQKWIQWSAISFASGSLIGGVLPILLMSQWSHQVMVKLVELIMAIPFKG